MKYWVYMNGEVPGSFSPAELSTLSGFNASSLVCPAEGEILEKNWRHAAEFAEVVSALKKREKESPPPASARPLEQVGADEVQQFLDNSSNRLFKHVTELMKELQNRREERSLTQSLQRMLVELKDQLQKTREQSAVYENRASRVPELEESVRQARLESKSISAALKSAEDSLAEARIKIETGRSEAEAAKRKLSEASNDLMIRNRLVEKLNHDLSDKELALAKALAVIRRFEEDLQRLCPEAAGENPPLSADAKGPQQPDAQSALVSFVKKYVNDDQKH